MELKDLGLQKLKLNINDDIIETVFAKEGDHKSRGLDVQVLKNNVVTDTTGVEVEFYAKPKDGEVYLVLAKEKDLKRGKYEIIYPTHILQPGPVKVEIKLVKGEQVISTKKFILEVENAISTDDIVEKSDERPLLAILVEAAKNEKSRIEAENKRVVAESKRVETENQREQNESQRKSAESQRQKNEEERKSSEVQRQSNESTRQSQENKRNEAENKRAANEESRKGSEATRRIDENKRVAAENERVKNEDARKTNENTRIANEKKREQNRKIVESWIANPSQFNGKDLEFIWNGTKLGVRLKGDTEYQYVDLKGQKGDPGDVGNLTAEQVISALNYQPAKEEEFTTVKTDVHRLWGDMYEVEDLVFKQNYVLNEHTRNITGNPHNVDKSQVGLGNVKNVEQVAKLDLQGIITMWSGNLADLPNGWLLCDGTNGTPDLRDRFILGASGTDIGDRGGSHTKTISQSNLPSHSHSFTTNSSGNHTHVGRYKNFSMKETPNGWAVLRRAISADSYDGTANAIHSSGGAHTHSGTTSSVGSGSSIDIRPKYYKLAFIMYVG
ncbi:BppU family phage baseplate upper protein [Bacteroidales bacterium MSK.15.36]|nr:BppU family phage baseplate upper protein [Bacteroidales bacterium MSK.15.36]